jgi:hypothetical protein
VNRPDIASALPPGPGRTACMQAAAAAHAQLAEQRRLILAFPDLAARLCAAPIGFKRPEQWTGYIPPTFDRERPDGTVPQNDSPVRAALLALLEQAAERWDRGERAPAPIPMPVLVLQPAPEPAGAPA